MTDTLIVGPGFVGGLVAEKLLNRGDRVWVLKRSERDVPQGATPIFGNIADEAICAEIPKSIETIYYAVSPSSSELDSYREAYVDGIRALLNHLSRSTNQTRRLIVTSSTGVYHQKDGSWVDESSPTRPERKSAAQILVGEELLKEAALETISYRLSGIYGPGRNRLIRMVAAGQATYVEGQPHFTNRIHREDCALSLIHLMEIEKPEPIYIGVDHDTAKRVEVLGWIAEQIGAPQPKGIQAEAASPRLRFANKRCKNDLLVASGYPFRFPSYRDGYEAMLKTWKAG